MTVIAKGMRIEELLDIVAAGNDVDFTGRNWGVKSHKSSPEPYGVIEFWYNGNCACSRLVTQGMGRSSRKKIMEEMESNSKNLRGEKYFIWKPRLY